MIKNIVLTILGLLLHFGLQAQNVDLKPCKNAEGKWGYCNSQGKVVIDYKYSAAQGFWENTYAIAKNQANFYAVINTKGEEVIKQYGIGASGVRIVNKDFIITYHQYNEFARRGQGKEHRYYRVYFPQNKEYAKEGFEVLNINKYITGNFDKDFADLNFIKIKNEKGLKGYVNKKGDVIVPIKYNIWGDFNEGLVFFEKEKGAFGVVDTTGKELFFFEDKMVTYPPSGFSSGLALVNRNNNEAYFIDRAGKKVIDLGNIEKKEGVGHFMGEIAPIYKNGAWRFVDRKGNLLPDEYYEISGLELRDYTWEIFELIWVSKKNKKTGEVFRGFVNGKGKVVIHIEHTSLLTKTDKDTQVEFIQAEKKDKKGNILVGGYNKEGKIIKPFEPKK